MFTLRLICWLFRVLFGRDRVESRLAQVYRLAFSQPSQRALNDAILRRIYGHSFKREPTGHEAAAVLRESAAVHACLDVATTASPDEWPSWIERTSLDFLPSLDGLRKKGRGVILATPHFGNAMLFLAALACRGIRVSALALYGEPLRRISDRNPNVRFLSLGTAAADCLRALAANEVVLLLDDMDFFPGGRTADFFGAPVRPPHGPARLALASGAPILPVYAVLQGDRWRLVCDEPVIPETSTQEEIERRLLRSMESQISRRPGHWTLHMDLWDLSAGDRALRLQMRQVRFARWLGRTLEKVKGLFRAP